MGATVRGSCAHSGQVRVEVTAGQDRAGVTGHRGAMSAALLDTIVDPAYQRRGIGRRPTSAGLIHVRFRGPER